MNFDTECKECSKYAKKIQLTTAEYLLEMVQKLKNTDCPKHLPAPAVMIIAFATVGEVLGDTIREEIKRIEADPKLTDEEKHGEITIMLKAMTSTCFQTMEDALPIKIHAAGGMNESDSDKVMGFIDGLKTEGTDEVQH